MLRGTIRHVGPRIGVWDDTHLNPGVGPGRQGELAVLMAAGSRRDPGALATLIYRDPMTEWMDRRKLWQIALIGCGAGLVGASLAIAGALSGGAPFRVAAAVSVALAGSLSGTLSLTGGMLVRRWWRSRI
jgi:hypothetical protein